MALASTAGTTVVTVLTTDAWGRAKTAIGALWRRAYPDRAETIEAELSETREMLLAAQERAQEQGDDVVLGEQELAEGMADEWRGRFRRLLAANPDIAREVRRILEEELVVSPQEEDQITSIVFHANPTGHARVYQAGRDQHIAER